MPKEFTQEEIDQYLNNTLEGETLRLFKEKMDADPEFKKEIDTQAFLHRGVNKFGEDQMRQRLKEIRTEVLRGAEDKRGEPNFYGGQKEQSGKVVSMKTSNKNRLILRWSMAAGVAIAVGAALYLMATWQQVSSDDLFASHYQPFSEEITIRNTEVSKQAAEASRRYKAGEYEAALPLFQELIKTESDNAELQMAIGICQLELNRYEKAVQTFSAVVNPLYKDQAQWYLAMTLLKQSDLQNAKVILESFEAGDFNYKKAQEILQEM